MKACWLTDIHLDFLSEAKRKEFYSYLNDSDSEICLITGDIANGEIIEELLIEMNSLINKKIYFVLGNHDYYCSSIKNIRESLPRDASLKLIYLTNSYVPVCPSYDHGSNTDCYIIGVDGWYDGGYGDYENSGVWMNDFNYIADFNIGYTSRYYNDKNKESILRKIKEIALSDSYKLKIQLDYTAKTKSKKILILTHVPPFEESSYHRGEKSSDQYLPFYASKSTGDVLLEVAEKRPDTEFLVLCGHAHGKSLYKPLPNLTVKCGEAEYGVPKIQEIIEI